VSYRLQINGQIDGKMKEEINQTVEGLIKKGK